MNEYSVFVNVMTLGAPYWCPTGLAVVGAMRPAWLPWRGRLFANPFAGLGAFIFGLGLLSLPLSFGLFNAFGCEGGFLDPVDCHRLSPEAGTLLYDFGLNSLIVTLLVGLPCLFLCAVAEGVTRYGAVARR